MKTYRDWSPTTNDIRGLNLHDRQGWLVCPVIRTRDSGCLEESNWSAMLEVLGGESDTVEVHRFGHWANGWFEIILVDPSDLVSVNVATEAESTLMDYPVLDEEDWSDRESRLADETWERASIRDRWDYLRGLGLSCLAARHPTLGQLYDRTGFDDDQGTLRNRLISC